jgi:hypothetical protein
VGQVFVILTLGPIIFVALFAGVYVFLQNRLGLASPTLLAFLVVAWLSHAAAQLRGGCDFTTSDCFFGFIDGMAATSIYVTAAGIAVLSAYRIWKEERKVVL